ncbi:hypothetical protein D3C86_1158330 [compost metagenome]
MTVDADDVGLQHTDRAHVQAIADADHTNCAGGGNRKTCRRRVHPRTPGVASQTTIDHRVFLRPALHHVASAGQLVKGDHFNRGALTSSRDRRCVQQGKGDGVGSGVVDLAYDDRVQVGCVRQGRRINQAGNDHRRTRPRVHALHCRTSADKTQVTVDRIDLKTRPRLDTHTTQYRRAGDWQRVRDVDHDVTVRVRKLTVHGADGTNVAPGQSHVALTLDRSTIRLDTCNGVDQAVRNGSPIHGQDTRWSDSQASTDLDDTETSGRRYRHHDRVRGQRIAVVHQELVTRQRHDGQWRLEAERHLVVGQVRCHRLNVAADAVHLA